MMLLEWLLLALIGTTVFLRVVFNKLIFVRKILDKLLLVFVAGVIFYGLAFHGFEFMLDELVANTVPHYPNAIGWNLSTSGDFPSTESPSANIVFSTKDQPEQIFNFYKEEAVKHGWTLVEEYGSNGHYGVSLGKKILTTKFYISIHIDSVDTVETRVQLNGSILRKN